MAFKRTCECGENTEAMYYYKAVKEGKFDIWSEVKYDTERVGPIRKTITVASNASVPMVALKIKGEVVEQAPEE